MSEIVSNDPEQKKPEPLFDDCKNKDCKKDYQLTAMNTELYTHETQPDCDHMICRCTECDNVMFYFIDEHWRDQLRLNGIHDNTENKNAEEWVYQRMLRVRGIELVQPVEITDRHEKLIANLGKTLDSILVQNPDLFWDEMNSPNDWRPHNQRWT